MRATQMSIPLSYQERSQSRKRRRTVISCTECHRRKQKCDRNRPCSNCVRRETQNLCDYQSLPESYQPKPSSSNRTDLLDIGSGINIVHTVSPDKSGPELAYSEVQSSLQRLGYSSQDKYNSMTLLRATEVYRDQNSSLADSRPLGKPTFRNDAHRKYTEIVRTLPPHTVTDTLIRTFFTLVNWQYDLLDDKLFQEQLEAWRKISYADLQGNWAAIAPENLVFPALLLQVLAQALLVHSPRDPTINGILIMADMTFHDLGAQYSDAGAEILVLLGKCGITIGTVQAGLSRASFLKSTGKVIDAWHTLGTAIRDAQGIGLHILQTEHNQDLSVPKGEMRLTAVGQKIWVVLHIWDAHMAAVLGRPMATSLQLESLTRTIGDNEMQRELFSHWQTENEPPRPFDIIIAGYTVAYRYFQDIHHLEHHDPKTGDDLAVERIHAAIVKNFELLPSWCRLESPSLRFDESGGSRWLPAAREGLYSLIHLVLLTLHRPYVFVKTCSRTEALKAGVSILYAQERLFQKSEPHQRSLFTPVYASFDAIVLIAAIFLAFPNEDRERQAECIHAVERGIQRLDTVGQSNSMARSAHGVASSVYCRLMHRLGTSESTEGATNTLNSLEQTPSSTCKGSSSLASPGLSFDLVPPPRPTHDLFYYHLSSAQAPTSGTPLDTSFVGDITDSLNFEGMFSDADFWSAINEHACI